MQVKQKCFVVIPVIFCGHTINNIITPDDSCELSKNAIETTTLVSHDSSFYLAKNAIRQAAKDRHEHSITFGKSPGGSILISPIINGDTSNGRVNSNWAGSFADIHNHTNELPPSAGDLYYLVKLNSKNPLYNTRFVITLKGTVNALYVYDARQATDFISKYPAEHTPGFSPRFPEPIFDDVDRISIYFEGQGVDRLVAQERALAFVLAKYHTGTVLLKQNGDGNFEGLKIEEEFSGKQSKYVASVCK